MFDKSNYQFTGKHGEIVKKLTQEIDEKSKFQIFKRNVDVLFIAPIVGFLWNRRSEKDTSQFDGDDNKKINFEQLSKNKDIINTNYQLIMLLHDKEKVSSEERLNRAFRYGNKDKEKEECDRIFESYLLGGIEVLNEKILSNAVDINDYIANMYDFINEYNDRKATSNMSADDIIIKFLN